MSRTRKASKASGNDPRQKLTGDFVTALQADWQLHGQDIIEALRNQNPVKYPTQSPPSRAPSPCRRLTTSASVRLNWTLARCSWCKLACQKTQ